MNVLVTGADGQVGGELKALLPAAGHNVFALSRKDLDICDRDEVFRAVSDFKPTHVINCAAYNAVDRAEDEEGLAYRVNGVAPRTIAEAAKEFGAIVAHYSTDYVFDGTKVTDYVESDSPNPICVYGRTKLAGELGVAEANDRHYIFRTAWVFSAGGTNFISRLVARSKTQREFQFVNDNWGTPTFARDVAAATIRALEKKIPFGLYHSVGQRACTPYEWAVEVARLAGLDVKIEAVSSSKFKTKAKRPMRSVLKNSKLEALGIVIPDGLERTKNYFKVDTEN